MFYFTWILYCNARRYNVWGFALHITGQYCTVLALLYFMMMWARFLSFGDNNAVVRGVYWVVLSLNGAITIVSICVSCKLALHCAL